MIPRADQARNEKLLRKRSPDNPKFTSVYRLNVASGQKKWVREESTAFYSPGGQLLYMDGFLMDITAIHKFSHRKNTPFVVVNCGAIAENLPDHYRLRVWDEEGRPLPEKLAELGIDF